ncbi:uncharacterized protein G2W53_014541 [Senna tora]|uniref:Uncharacterized protein n=1 Tax=Senna tora TaxID=362788 RepID=A0A834WTG1_9FABA|nr:uncharacterized protein G2W53_014541 [Senna tora]
MENRKLMKENPKNEGNASFPFLRCSFNSFSAFILASISNSTVSSPSEVEKTKVGLWVGKGENFEMGM